MRKILIAVTLIALCGGGDAWLYARAQSPQPKATKTSSQQKQAPPAPQAFDKTDHSINDPTSIWVVVNKRRPLNPKDYIPSDLVVPNVPLRVPGNESMQLRQAAASALENMFDGAKLQGISLMLSSGYRSYAYQTSLYGSYVRSQGQAQADTFSARPGYSEHQTGLAADVEPLSQKCDVDSCFGNLPEGKWLAENAAKYGFIIRYTAVNQAEAGYTPEPWHVRYVGPDLAAEMQRTKATSLESFFGLPPAPNY